MEKNKKALVIPVNNEHFDLIVSQIQQIYLENPFDFLFIGPTGFYTRQIADKMAQNMGKTLNRNAFLVINQYVTELLLQSNYDAEVLDRDFYTIYISKTIEEMYEEARKSEDNVDNQRILLLRTLSKSNTIIQYIVEIFEKLWELELYGEQIETTGHYALVQSILNDESTFAQIVRDIVTNIKQAVKMLQSRSVYDPISVYNWYINNAKHIEKQRKYLVISGFFDMPLLIQKALKEMIEKSENVIFFVWQKIEDEPFETLREIYKFLEELNFQFDYTLCPEESISVKKLLEKNDISCVDTENVYFQYQYIVKEVKKLLLDGVKPEDIGIVVPNSTISLRIMDEFEEAKIPYRYSGKNSLVESQIVKILLQPLVTIENNYNSEDLLALIESPLLGIKKNSNKEDTLNMTQSFLVQKRTLTMDEIEQLFKEYNYFSINLTPSEMKDKEKRQEVYFKNLNEDIEFLKGKLKQNEQEFDGEESEDEEEIDVMASVKERLEKLENFKHIMERTFEILDDIHESRKNDVDFFDWYRGFIEKFINSNDTLSKLGKTKSSYSTFSTIKSLGKELNAFSKFIEVLNKLEMYIKKLRESNIVKELKSWDRIFKFLQVLLNTVGYRDTFKSANVIDIIDISTARFVTKKYKFFVEFTDDYYPSINKINPLLYRTNNERSKIYEVLENNERRNVILSFVFSECAKLLFPRATNTGEELVRSKYISEFCNVYEQATFTINDIFKEIDYKIYKLKNSTKQKFYIKPFDFIVGQTNVFDFSHSKLSNYLRCPLQFYYSSIADVSKPVKSSEKLSIGVGLIVHRVLRRFFEKPIGFHIDEDEVKNWIREEYSSIFSEGIWKYSVPREMKVNEILKSLIPLLRDFVESRRIIKLNAKSFKPGKDGKKTNANLISENTVALEKEFRINHGKYNLIVRIDRIDKVEQNYAMEDEKTPIDRPAYAIIDYKHSTSTDNSQIEQLLLYDYVISNSENDLIPKDKPVDFYLILLATKLSNGGYKYSYVKKEISESQYLVFKVKTEGEEKNNFIVIETKEFIDWLTELLNEISLNGDFTPVFIDPTSKSFINKISTTENQEFDVPKGSKQTRKCRGYGKLGPMNCPYEPVCSVFEVYGIKLVKG
ncbi:MAG: PD-(D/E)XK nuclease family protein [Fervidobacterium sp.]|nr:PD-(D/E)XK nuclease family protein [Fervidobacterium sp.]